MKISVIIPAYEPDEKMVAFIDSLIKNSFEDIIVVDDGSSAAASRYFDEAKKRPGVTVLVHEVNKGKGAALKTAFSYLAENRPDSDGAACADADGQHTAESIKTCLKAYEENPGCVILGGRDFNKGNIPARSVFGNKLSSFVYRFAVGIKLGDTQTGLRIIPPEYFTLFAGLKGNRYEYETQMLIAIGNNKIPYREVPIETIYIEGNESSHFNPVKDSIRIYAVVLKYFIKFAASSLSSYLIDIAIYAIILFLIENKVSTGVQVFVCTVVSRVLSSIFNFTMNRKTVFKATDNLWGTTIKYYTLMVCQMTASYLLVFLFTDILKVSGALQLIIKAVVDVVLFLFGYQIQRAWVFKNKKD